MEKEKKNKISLGFIIVGALVLVLAVYYIYVHFTTSPEEEAYGAAVQKIVEISDEKNSKSEEESSSKSYVEELAKDEDKEAQPYFDKYREEYVSKEKDGYLVELPVQEMLNYEVVREYTYEVHVQEKNGVYTVTSMERKNKE